MSRHSQYQCLCTVTLWHEYLNGPMSVDDIVLYDDATLRKICADEGLTIKPVNDAIQILYDVDDERYQPDHQVKVHLAIGFKDPEFYSFTSAGLEQPSETVFCSNTATRLQEGLGANIEYLHAGRYVDKTNRLGELSTAGQQSTSAQLLTSFAAPLIVELDLTELIRRTHEDAENYCARAYVIAFAARQAPWLYWLWLRHGKLKNIIDTDADLDNLHVQLNEQLQGPDAIAFERVSQLVSINNQTGVRFLSSKAAKLGACSNFTLSLVYSGELGEKTLIESLPHPTQGSLEMALIDKTKQLVAATHVSL